MWRPGFSVTLRFCLILFPVPTHPSFLPPRDSRRWRRAAHHSYFINNTENRSYLWLLVATVAVVLSVVGALVFRSLVSDGTLGQSAAFEQRP